MLRLWRLFNRQTKPNPIVLAFSLKSLHYCSHNLYPLNIKMRKPFEVYQSRSLSGGTFTTLTPQIVHATLLNCPSDVLALQFFLWCAKSPNYFHDRASFDHMVPVVNRLTDRFKTVSGIVKELETVGCIVKPQTFLILLRIYWCGEMYACVFEVCKEMIAYGYTLNTFARNVLIDVLFKNVNFDDALRVLNETQSPNFLTFNIAISNLCRLNDLFNVEDIIKTMLRERYYPNGDTFEHVFNCFCKAGRLAEAFQVLGLMTTLGIRLSVSVWSMLIDGYCKFGKLDLARALFLKMVQTGHSPNVVTYTSLVKGFMESQNVDSAFDILRVMESNGCVPDLILCNVLINGFCKLGRYDEAIYVFLRLSQQNLEPDCYTLSSILPATCMSQNFTLLLQLVSGCEVQLDLVFYNALLIYLCKAGFPSYAINFYNGMIEGGITADRYSFSGLLVALCKAGRIEDADNFYHGILMKYSDHDAHIHTVIIDGLIKKHRFHRAIKLFRKAVREKYPLDVVSYTVVILGLIKGDRIEEAYSLYSQMKDVGVYPNEHTYNVMLSGVCLRRDVKLVSEILQIMTETGIKMEYFTYVRVSNFMLKWSSSCLIFDLLIKMWDLGLMPDKAKHLLSWDGLAPYEKPGDASYVMSECKIIAGSSSSDDLTDLAASGG